MLTTILIYLSGVTVALLLSEYGNHQKYTNKRIPLYWNLLSWLWALVCAIVFAYIEDDKKE